MNRKNETKSGKVNGIVVAVLGLFLAGTATALIYGSMSGASIPDAEVNSLFDLADKNKDGNVTKEEFREYLEARKAVATAKTSNVRICPKTGAPCTGDGMCSSGDGEACGGSGCGKGDGGGCCDNKGMGAKTVPVKATTVTEGGEKKAGCCGGKTEGAKKEGGCCGGKAKAEGAKKEGGCCGGKAKAGGAKKEGGCCGGKAKAEGAKKEGGCCGGKAKTETQESETVEAETK